MFGENKFSDFVGGLSTAFINLSSEYPVILNSLFLLFAACGVVISSTAVFDVIRAGSKSNQTESTPRTVFVKFLGGIGLIDLSFWAKIWSASLWANEDVLGIDSYTAGSMGGYANEAMMAALGILVITGYVTLARAYFMIAKFGSLGPESRSNMVGSIIARIVAGSALISIIHIAKLIESSTDLKIITF